MPLYEYQCSKCGSVFEVRQKFSDEPLTVHEGCGGEVVRLLSAPALQFKGTGWYVTDYARASTNREKNESGKSDGKGESSKTDGSKSDSKGESSKSETKSESKPAPAKAE